ncbi:MAG: hypothetical protein GW902_07215, partial [Alphaproteobacteria bacterium]|nr:hypothetical protein [Alphaproteobacteria bacterium]
FAVKLRRFGASVNSAAATTGAATTRAAADAELSGEEGATEARRSGITIRSFSCALECELQTVRCLTLVGAEGAAIAKAIGGGGGVLPFAACTMKFRTVDVHRHLT